MNSALNPRARTLEGVSLPRAPSFFSFIWRCLCLVVRIYWAMTKRAPAFWAGCFVGAMVAQFPAIAQTAIHLALSRVP